MYMKECEHKFTAKRNIFSKPTADSINGNILSLMVMCDHSILENFLQQEFQDEKLCFI